VYIIYASRYIRVYCNVAFRNIPPSANPYLNHSNPVTVSIHFFMSHKSNNSRKRAYLLWICSLWRSAVLRDNLSSYSRNEKQQRRLYRSFYGCELSM